jgi:hypothetical protein
MREEVGKEEIGTKGNDENRLIKENNIKRDKEKGNRR